MMLKKLKNRLQKGRSATSKEKAVAKWTDRTEREYLEYWLRHRF